jgi:hypothetical protein
MIGPALSKHGNRPRDQSIRSKRLADPDALLFSCSTDLTLRVGGEWLGMLGFAAPAGHQITV